MLSPEDCLHTIQKSPLGLDCNIGEGKSVVFEILLEKNFPKFPPKVYCKSTFCKPSLADGRDLFKKVLKKCWKESNSLLEVIAGILSFLKTEINNNFDDDQSKLFFKYFKIFLGYFQIGSTYNLEDFLVLDSVDVFPLISDSIGAQYLIISATYLLFFSVLDIKESKLNLIAYSPFSALISVKRNKLNPDTIIITFLFDNQTLFEESLISAQSNQLFTILQRNIKNLGLKYLKTDKTLQLKEVTLKAYEKTNIFEVLENIAILESRLSEELTVELVNTLMGLYQKAIEYYSAINDPHYDDFLERMHLLLSRQEVQIVLQSKEESNSVKSKPQIQNPITDTCDDEEEEKKE